MSVQEFQLLFIAYQNEQYYKICKDKFGILSVNRT